MKISSVSKKVLASALSAAMVVAFAPTAAFGMVKDGEYVNVVLDPGVGQVAPGGVVATQLTAPIAASDDNELTIKAGDFKGYDALVAYTDNGKADGAALTGFVYDNGTAEDTSDDITLEVGTNAGQLGHANGATLNLPATAQPNSTITLKAVYGAASTVAVTKTTPLVSNTGAVQQKKSVDPGVTKLTQVYTVNAGSDSAGKYAVSVRKDGTELASVTHDGRNANVAYTFTWDGEGEGALKSSDWGVGTWTVVLVKDGKDVKTIEQAKIVKVTVKGGVWGSNATDMALSKEILAFSGKISGDDYKVANALNNANVGQPKKELGSATGAQKLFTPTGEVAAVWKGSYWSSTGATATATALKGDLDLTANFGEATVAPKMALATNTAGEYTITATIAGDANTYETNYRVDFAGPSASKTVKAPAGAVTYNFGTTEPTPGTYTATVYGTKKGTAVEEEIGKATVAIVAYSYDVADNADKVKATGFVAGGEKWSAALLNQGVTNAKARLLGWTLDGSTLLTTDSVIPSDVTSVVLKAAWDNVKAAKPAFTYADGYLTFTSDAGAGFTLTAGGHESTTGALAIKVDPKTDVTYTAQVVRGTNCTSTLQDSETVTVYAYGYDALAVSNNALGTAAAGNYSTNKTAATAMDEIASQIMAEKTAAYTDKVPEYYLTVLKSAKEAAVQAVKDHGFDTEKGWNATILAQTEGVLKAVADYNKAQIDAYAAGVKQADGSIIKVNAAVAAAAKANIDKVIADYGYATDDADAKTMPSKARTTLGAYAADMSAENKAAVKAGDVFSADDVKAAEAVTAQLQAAKTAAEAEAALAAYKGLTDSQKELVAAADLAAAQAVIEAGASQELIDAQDKAAVKYVNNPKTKTVKLATAKKGKAYLTYKSKVSASGHVVTYKKVSGAKIKVSKAGKVTLAKVTKAGTYTGKVKVTCGNAKRTVKVKFIVK